MNFVILTPNWVSQEQKIQFLIARFRDILWFRKWHLFKQTKTKNGRHFFISSFDNFQLCFFVQKDSSTLKVLKMQFIFSWDYENLVKMNNAARLWSIFLSLSQRQIAILGPLEWRNLFGQKSKIVSFQKLIKRSGIHFLILFVLMDSILLSCVLRKRPNVFRNSSS